MSDKYLTWPPSELDLRELHAGDRVLLSGEIVATAGLPTIARIAQYAKDGHALPVDLDGSLFHLGTLTREVAGRTETLYLNPTTSTRFHRHMPEVIRSYGLRLTGGKGGLDPASAAALADNAGVYLSFLGGGCTPLSEAIRGVVAVGWTGLIAHYRLVKLAVRDLGPLTVGIDAHGRNLYDDLASGARDRLPQILAGLAAAREAQS